jgi:membrane protease YdiL (CAAX protease family)
VVHPPRSLSQRRLVLELCAFAAAVVGLTLVSRRVVLPAILLGAALALVVLLRDPSFDRRLLWNAAAVRAGAGRLALRVALAVAGLTALTWLLASDSLLAMARQRPGLWLLVMLGYPLVSVYPQELLFRALFHHRFRPLFPGPRARVVASALVFAAAHLVLRNFPAILLSFIGGLLFARTYERDRSLLLVSVEHGLLGDWIFTVGMGAFFYDGATGTAGPFRF